MIQSLSVGKIVAKMSIFRLSSHLKKLQLQWNVDLSKLLVTGQICSLNQGFVIWKFIFIYFTVTGAINTVRYIEVSLNRGSLNRGSTVLLSHFSLFVPKD